MIELRDEQGAAASVVDVGFGDSPVTTLEFASAMRQLDPSVRVLGFELDAARAGEAARRFDDALTEFRQGGFGDAAGLHPAPRVIRVMNVLRAYPASEAPLVHALLSSSLADGGVLLEGTCDTSGHVLCAWVFRRRAKRTLREGLVLFTDFTRGFSPWLFRDFLPRDIRRSVQPGSKIHTLLTAWTAAWNQVRSRGVRQPGALFDESLSELVITREDIERCDDVGAGFAWWKLGELLDNEPDLGRI